MALVSGRKFKVFYLGNPPYFEWRVEDGIYCGMRVRQKWFGKYGTAEIVPRK